MSASKKQNRPTDRGCYHFVNVYWKDGGGLRFGGTTYETEFAARSARRQDGTYVCTAKVTTQMEIV